MFKPRERKGFLNQQYEIGTRLGMLSCLCSVDLWNALYWQNMPVVMNTLLIVGIISLGARLIIDVIAAYLDPRIRYQDPQINHA